MKSTSSAPARAAGLLVAVLLPAATGCWRQKMADQPAPRPLEASTFFADGRASRPIVEGTVPRGEAREDEAFVTGRAGADFVETFPFRVDRAALERGRERYDIFCSPCHDRVGEGQGMVVLRGYPKPPSLHLPRLRDARAGYLYDVVTRGFGRMPSYAPQIPAADRWAIVAYIRALQLSQKAQLADVPPAERPSLERQNPGAR
jgi:mono/diheme cytochrome c family protein